MAFFRKTCVVNFVSGAVFAVFVGSVAHADSKPAWAEQAPDGTFWSWVNAYGVTDYATTDYTAQYLLNVAAAKTLAALSIDGIEVGSAGATVRITATAGGEAVDLSKINGVLAVAAGDDPGSLTPKAIPSANVTYGAGATKVFVPSSYGSFIRMSIGILAPGSRPVLVWNGGSTAWRADDGKYNWLTDNGDATRNFHNGDSVIFTSRNAGTVTFWDDLHTPSMTVSGGVYTFEGDGRLYATDLAVSGGDMHLSRDIDVHSVVLSGTGTKLTVEQPLRLVGAFEQNGGTMIVNLGRLNGAAALSGEDKAELKIGSGNLELIGDTATPEGNVYTIASGFAAITTTWTNICVSGHAEGRNVRYDVESDDTSVRVSVTCDPEPHTDPFPGPDPGPGPSTP